MADIVQCVFIIFSDQFSVSINAIQDNILTRTGNIPSASADEKSKSKDNDDNFHQRASPTALLFGTAEAILEKSRRFRRTAGWGCMWLRLRPVSDARARCAFTTEKL